MPAKAGLTKVENIDVTARELDFVTRFAKNWDSLREILGIMRPIRKANGTTLRSFTATVTLAQSVGEGEEIPYSPAEVEEAFKEDITVEKYAKGTSIEAINKWGADIAIAKTVIDSIHSCRQVSLQVQRIHSRWLLLWLSVR